MNKESPAETKLTFDPAAILEQAFSYLKHFRLMLIMLAFGILAGLSYFVYATPVYQARSLVHFQGFGSPLSNRELPETTTSISRITRSTLTRLASQELQIRAAQRLNLIGDIATFEDVGKHVPKVRIGLSDHRHLEVTVQAYDPEVVRVFCNALVDEFQELQEEGWSNFRDEAIERYAKQLEELEKKIEENIDSLSAMEREKSFTEAKFEQQSLLQIPRELVQTREQLARMDSIRSVLQKYDSDVATSENTLLMLSLLSGFEKDSGVRVGELLQRNTGASATFSPDGTAQVVIPSEVEGLESWRELEKQKRVLEQEFKEASEIYLPDHPKMKELTNSLADTDRSLQTEMVVMRQKFDLEYERLTEKQSQLEARIPEYQKITDSFGQSERAFNSIEQSQLMWNEARKRLSEKLSTLSFVDEYDWVELRFKEHTSLRDKNPIAPTKKKLAMLGILLGLAGAIGLPTLLNLFDSSAKSLPQMELYLGLKGMGIVPLTDPQALESVYRSPAQGSKLPNYLLECFRVIRANIGLESGLPGGPQAQVILVTSARPQEGKTTQSANLAWAFHSMGERVLLIDCDLRRGRIHKLLKIDNSVGMSRLLTHDVSSQNAIVETVQKGFEAIPRGPIIPGSTELLCQEGFFNQIQKWRNEYDRIILDCPPVLGLSESSSLQRLADGVVLVVRSEKTPAKDSREAVRMLKKTGAHFYGFVLNCVDLSKVGNYYNYYYYSAPYYDQFDDDTDDADSNHYAHEGQIHSHESAIDSDSGNLGIQHAADSRNESPPQTSVSPHGEIEPLQEDLSVRATGKVSDEIEPWIESPEDKDWLQQSFKKEN